MSRPKKKKIVQPNKIINKNELVKSKTVNFQLAGVKDILPKEQKYWQLVKNRAEQLAKDYDFEKIDTPLIEKMSLFEKIFGKQNNFIINEIFSFTDKEGENIVLRPAATFSIARAYLEYKMINFPQPVKLYYCGPMFRYSNLQAGNYRQFHQFGFEVLGSPHPVIDAQLILIAFNFYKEMGIPVTIQINSIGCSVCRGEYRRILNDYYRQKKNLFCENCKLDFNKNIFKIFNCQENKCQELREEAPQIIDYLCEDCKNHFIKVLEYLDELELPYILNPYLIRRANYGTKTIFEIWPEEAKKVNYPLAGGGRYDDLVEKMGGELTPACGFSAGIEHIVLKIKEEDLPVPARETYDIFLAQLGEQARRKSLILFEDLKEKGIKVAESFSKDGLKPQLEIANRLGVKFILILGQKEVLDGTIMIRDREGGVQEVVDFNKITLEIQKRLMKQ